LAEIIHQKANTKTYIGDRFTVATGFKRVAGAVTALAAAPPPPKLRAQNRNSEDAEPTDLRMQSERELIYSTVSCHQRRPADWNSSWEMAVAHQNRSPSPWLASSPPHLPKTIECENLSNRKTSRIQEIRTGLVSTRGTTLKRSKVFLHTMKLKSEKKKTKIECKSTRVQAENSVGGLSALNNSGIRGNTETPRNASLSILEANSSSNSSEVIREGSPTPMYS